jgi:hypothetical protein
MNSLETIVEMRKTLTSMNERLTPYSGKAEHQRYLDNLQHYKKILNAYITRSNEEIDIAIHKSYTIVKNFIVADIKKMKAQVENGAK